MKGNYLIIEETKMTTGLSIENVKDLEELELIKANKEGHNPFGGFFRTEVVSIHLDTLLKYLRDEGYCLEN